MLNPHYFIDRPLQVGFNVTLDIHHFNQANSKRFNKPDCLEFGLELQYINQILKEMANIYARLTNQ